MKQFISIFDTIDRSFTTKNYCQDIPEIKKDQVTGDALKHLIRFIDWCLIEREVKNEFKKSKLK